jgi:hypothetical protein
MSLAAVLANDGYQRVPLMRTAVGHFETPGSLNDHPIRVLIDTGAASTVVSLSLCRELGLDVVSLGRTGGGAGGANLEIFELRGAVLRLGDVQPRPRALYAMDFAHVNQALAQKGAPGVDAILGVDVFEGQAAVIDYASASLFLRDG